MSRFPILAGFAALMAFAATSLAPLTADPSSAASTRTTSRVLPRGGGGGSRGAATTISVAAANAHPLKTRTRTFGVLRQDGTVGNRATTTRPDGVKPVSPPAPTRVNTHGAPTPRGPLVAPSQVNANFPGIAQGSSDCGSCQPPDPNAAVSPSEIAHVVNLRMQVYNKEGGLLCGTGLGSLMGTTEAVSDPHLQWDNLWQRWSMVFIPVPSATNAVPRMFLLTSVNSDACGQWRRIPMTFFGGLYPPGTLLDYPYLGQDRDALLLSSNNFQLTGAGFQYRNSAIFSIPKFAAYTGQAFSFSSFGTGFSTAPPTVTGNPILPSNAAFFLRTIPGTGYQLYGMTGSGTTNASVTAEPVAVSPFAQPVRNARQPGTAPALDVLDGRMSSTTYQDGGLVWFAHTQSLASFPAVRYGVIFTSSNAVVARNAFRSGTSDDWNPSIAVQGNGGGLVSIFANWTFTDPGLGIGASMTVDGVRPGQGIPALIGTGIWLVRGGVSASASRFGDLSSAAIDPSPAPGCSATAVVSNEVFNGVGTWLSWNSRISFC